MTDQQSNAANSDKMEHKEEEENSTTRDDNQTPSGTSSSSSPASEKSTEETDNNQETTNENNNNNKSDPVVDGLTQALQQQASISDHKIPQVAAPKALKKFASWIRDGLVNDILVVTGAGISVSAGIPDFRTKGTGLYDNLEKYNLPYPEAVFDLDFYTRQDPQPFVTLAKELWPTGLTFRPTWTHCFLTLLARKQLLRRVYSQNIDGLEHLAGLPTDKLVECHGHFRTASCTRCGTPAPDMETVKETIIQHTQVPLCHKCKSGYIKPDIVFFGEGLPDRFHDLLPGDLQTCDCCLVLGTSLQVAPVSMIPEQVQAKKRVLLNREKVGSFSRSKRHEDVYHLDPCDDSIRLLAELLGWLDDLEELHKEVTETTRTTKKE